MRITQNSIIQPFNHSLRNLQENRYKENVRLATGKKILSIADAPKEIANIKQFSSMIDRNSKYLNNIETALREMQSSSTYLDTMQQKIQDIRQLSIDATQSGNADNLYTQAQYIRGIFEDIIRDANMDHNGKYLFSGTLRNEEGIRIEPPATNKLPFEIIEGEKTAENPSGLSVVFKGNNKDRIIHKDQLTSEVINAKAEEMFGEGAVEIFDSVIKLYNLLAYNSDGEIRGVKDYLTIKDTAAISEYQKTVQLFSEKISNVNARMGATMNRLENIRDQMLEESVRLKHLRSVDEDTDVSRSAIELARHENALQYTLQIGSRIFSQTLFDFLR